MRPRATAHRTSALWIAFLIHRVSGVALACFLPLHFLVLGLAIESEARLDHFLAWTASPLVKAMEMGLIFLLAIHLLGGVRLLLIEGLPWREGQKQLATAALAAATVSAFVFLIRSL